MSVDVLTEGHQICMLRELSRVSSVLTYDQLLKFDAVAYLSFVSIVPWSVIWQHLANAGQQIVIFALILHQSANSLIST